MQIEYVKYMQSIVKQALASEDSMTDADMKDSVMESLVNQMITRYPYLNDYGIGTEKLVGWGIAGLVKELKDN